MNSSGEFLKGWSVDPATGTADQTVMSPVQINQAAVQPGADLEPDALGQPAGHARGERADLVADPDL